MKHLPKERLEEIAPLKPKALEDIVLKFIENHHFKIWIAIALISAVVIWRV